LIAHAEFRLRPPAGRISNRLFFSNRERMNSALIQIKASAEVAALL
jgi:hypothetical protein